MCYPDKNAAITQYTMIDGSWDTSDKAGAGAIHYDYRGQLMEIRYFSYKAGDAMHAVIVAVATAVDRYLAQ
jgi:hypothetical protein